MIDNSPNDLSTSGAVTSSDSSHSHSLPAHGGHSGSSATVRKRLERFMRLVARVLGGEGGDAVHDLRVWSRRLQQSLAWHFPEPRPRAVRAAYKDIRKARQAVGAWRDCDVLLERFERKRRLTRSVKGSEAYALVAHIVEKERRRVARRARKKLLALELFEHAQQLEDELRSDAYTEAPPPHLHGAVSEARAKWHIALKAAHDDPTEGNLHALRIQTKRLRYRVELIEEMGGGSQEDALGALKVAQEALGEWHDRCALARTIAHALADEHVLMEKSEVAIVLLKELASLSRQIATEVQALLSTGNDSPLKPLQSWLETQAAAGSPLPEPAAAPALPDAPT